MKFLSGFLLKFSHKYFIEWGKSRCCFIYCQLVQTFALKKCIVKFCVQLVSGFLLYLAHYCAHNAVKLQKFPMSLKEHLSVVERNLRRIYFTSSVRFKNGFLRVVLNNVLLLFSKNTNLLCLLCVSDIKMYFYDFFGWCVAVMMRQHINLDF